MRDAQWVHRIGSQRVDQRGDLRRIDLAVAGADSVDAVDGLGVAEQGAQAFEGFRRIADHVHALGVVWPHAPAVLPGLRPRPAPCVKVFRLGGIGTDDRLDFEMLTQTTQRGDEQRLRVGQPGQPDMCHPFWQALTTGQFRAQVIVVAQTTAVQTRSIALFQGRQVIPAGLFWVGGQGGHPGEV